MRLAIFDTKAKLSARVVAQIVRFVEGFSPDIVKVFLYRSELFGDLFQPMLPEVMRAGTEWTAGERELMAALVSSKNQCWYCTDAHRATAAVLVGESVANAVTEGAETAEISERLRAMLVFLEKLTVSPRDITPADIEPLRRAGLSEPAIENAIEVCVHFCMINRLADTFGFRLQSPRQLANEARMLARKGYKL